MVRNTAAIAGPQLAGLGLSFLLSVVVARWLGAAEFGTYTYVLSWVAVLALASVFGVDTLLVRHAASYSSVAAWQLLWGLLRWANGLVLVASVTIALMVASAAPHLFGGAHRLSPATWLFAAALLPLTGIARAQQAALRGLHRPALSQLPEMVVQPALMLAVVIACVGAGPRSAPRALLAHALTLGVAVAVALWLVHRSLPPAVRFAQPRYEHRLWLATSFRFFLLGGVSVLNSRIDVLALGALGSPAAVGPYSAAVRGAALIPLALDVAVVAMMPRLAGLYAIGDHATMRSLVRRMSQLALLVGIPVAAVMFLAGGQFLSLFGAGFGDAEPALRILAVGQLVNIAAGPVATLLVIAGYERDAVIGVGASAVVNALLSVALVPQWGMNGAATAAASGIALWNILLWWRVRRRLSISSTVLHTERPR